MMTTTNLINLTLTASVLVSCQNTPQTPSRLTASHHHTSTSRFNDFVITIDTRNEGKTNKNSYELQTGTGTFNYHVDWNNDGHFDQFNLTTSVIHTYKKPGKYTIRIAGQFPHYMAGVPEFQLDETNASSQDDRHKLIEVNQWGTQRWRSMHKSFQGAKHIVFKANDIPNLSRCKDLSFMLSGIHAVPKTLTRWKTSAVTNMSHLFAFNSDMDHAIGTWDVSNVTDMTAMFESARNFQQPLTHWNTQNVTSMQRMFKHVVHYNQPLYHFKTHRVTDMSQMFAHAHKFNQPLARWDTSQVRNMALMFASAYKFNQPLNPWQTQHVTSMKGMFYNAFTFNQPLGTWNTSQVKDMSNMFEGTRAFNQPLGTWTIGHATNTKNMFKNASAYKHPKPTQQPS